MTPAVALLERLAEETWDRLTVGQSLRVSLGEETFTDLNILELRKSGLSDVFAVQLTKGQEAIYGADWEWWVGDPSSGWFHYVVQAKKLELSTASYRSLRHICKDGRSPDTQLERLEQFAKTYDACPIYCFYNGGIEDPAARVTCTERRPKQYGCTIASLAAVKPAHKKHARKWYENIHRGELVHPWRCIVADHASWSAKVGVEGKHPLSTGADMSHSFQKELPPAIKEMFIGNVAQVTGEYLVGLAPPRYVVVTNTSENPRLLSSQA